MGYDQPKSTRACRMVATQPPLPEFSGGLPEASGGALKELRSISKSSPSGKVSNVLRRLPEGFRKASGGSGGRQNKSGSTVKELPRFTPEHNICYSGMLRRLYRGFGGSSKQLRNPPERSGVPLYIICGVATLLQWII